MTRFTVVLALMVASGCAHRDVSRGMEDDAIRAALDSRLVQAADEAETDDFWHGMKPMDGVVFADGTQEMPTEPIVVDPEPKTDMVQPVAVTAKVEAPPVAIVPAPAGPVAQADPFQGLLSGRSGGTGELVRAIDDLRWTMTLEARLGDKQRLIDELRKDVDYPGGIAKAGVPAGKDPTVKAMAERIDALTAAQTAADQARLEEVAAAEARAELERVAAEEAQTAADAEKELLMARIATLETPAEEVVKPVEPEPKARGRDKNRDEDRMASSAEIADLKAQIAALAVAQSKSEVRRERQIFRIFKKKAKYTETETTPVQPVVVQSDAETERLQAELARAEAARLAAQNEGDDNLATLEARLAAFEADRARIDEMKAELEAGQGNAARLKELEAATAALEGDRAKLGSLQSEVAALAEERARLEADLANADQARRAELEAERAAFEARTGELNAELLALRTRQAEMEQKFTDRQQAVMARLKPLIDSGLRVRQFEGNIVVDLPSDVLFASGSSNLSRAGADEVKAVASALEPFPTLKIQVQGHTDNVPVNSGRFKNNWDLAFARSSAVLQVLLDGGLPPQRVSAASFGETRPISNNDNPTGRGKNRRIELALELPPLEENP